MRNSPRAKPSERSMSTVELVTMVAGLMALNALAIDVMLPALSEIAADLPFGDQSVPNPNDQQLVVVAYVIGFGAPQLVFGPLADRLGRRPVLFVSLIGYVLAGVACIVAQNFEQLLALRFVQGMFAAGCRVVAVTIVRDLFAGSKMARIMSLVMTVFMIVPIVAPTIGQGVLLIAPWRWCFVVLGIAGAAMLVWTWLRVPETLGIDRRSRGGAREIVAAYGSVLRNRVTLGYMVASGVIFGALFAFISASEQIFRDVFDQGDSFALWFAGVASTLAITNFANSKLVGRFGMRRLSHLALVAFIAVSAALLGIMSFVGEHLVLFYPLFATAFALFGLIGVNFSAIAMEPLGRIAGTASAAYGFATTTLSGVLGGLIARAFDGTTLPVLAGYVLLGLVSLASVAVAERGRLFGDDPPLSPLRATRS